ncbi:MAG TPA: archease [bacterium]|nr:archease [bacterium]
MSYRVLEHTADIRLRVSGRSFAGLLKNAVFALTDQILDARSVRAIQSRKLRVRGSSLEELFVKVLQECLFLFDARGFAVRTLRGMRLEGDVLEGVLRGERFSPRRHGPKSEVKAVTFHGLKVKRRLKLWSAEIVLDV